ncbi:MAG: hypothetical protein LBU79_02215, partial [Planctomycetota bacterium]|nr:hypothetical protein [Planctomycetota bacterium]
REAEAIIKEAEAKAARRVATAKTDSQAATEKTLQAAQAEVARLQDASRANLATRVAELTAKGDAALQQVTKVPEKAYAKGVKKLLDALAGSK